MISRKTLDEFGPLTPAVEKLAREGLPYPTTPRMEGRSITLTKQQHDATRRGRSAEYLAAAWLLRNHDVWVSVMPDAASTDLMIQLQSNPRKRLSVQVKRVFDRALTLKSGRRTSYRTVNLSRSDGSKYTPELADYVLAVDEDNLMFWLLPVRAGMPGRIRLTKTYSGYAFGWSDAAPALGGWK